MRNLLIDEYPIFIYPNLAKEIGLNEAIILTYIETNGSSNISELSNKLNFFSISTIQRTLTNLEKQGLIEDISLSDPYEIKRKVISAEEDKNMCGWCKAKSITLHEHHFPIPRKDGGKETVKICPNCHYGYHYLESRRYEVKQR